MKAKKSLFTLAAFALAAVAPLSHAVYIDTFQGLTFSFEQTDTDTLTFDITGTPTGDWATANYLGAFGLKDLGLDFSTVTATLNGPGAAGLSGENNEVSANGQDAPDCNSMGSPAGAICFDIADVALGMPINLSYTIVFSEDLNIGSDGPHLKIAFLETSGGVKVGSLYSQNVPSNVPEPNSGSLTLLGLAVLGVAMWARRRKAGLAVLTEQHAIA